MILTTRSRPCRGCKPRSIPSHPPATHTPVCTTLPELLPALGGHTADADPHTQYQRESEKGVANGYVPLNASSQIDQAFLPAGQAPVTDHGQLTGLNDDDHPEYLTTARADPLYEFKGVAATAAAAHVAASDPHTGYQKENEKDVIGGYVGKAAVTGESYVLLATGSTAKNATVGASGPEVANTKLVDDTMDSHLAAADPHPGYLTPAEGNAAYEALGVAATADAAHVAHANPHTQYVLKETPPGDLASDGLAILASGPTTWETKAVAMARYGLTSWTGRLRYVSIDYPDHPAPPSPVVGDLWDQRVTT